MTAATMLDDTEASFHADYIHLDTGRSHRVVDGAAPVMVDGFDWTAQLRMSRTQPSRGYTAGAVVGDTIRARGVITAVEADENTYLIEVSPDV